MALLFQELQQLVKLGCNSLGRQWVALSNYSKRKVPLFCNLRVYQTEITYGLSKFNKAYLCAQNSVDYNFELSQIQGKSHFVICYLPTAYLDLWGSR